MSPQEKVIYSGIVALTMIWFWLWSVVDSALGDPKRFRTGSKSLWLTLCLLIPTVGGAVYMIIGRNYNKKPA